MLFPRSIHALRIVCVCALTWLLWLLPATAGSLQPLQTGTLPALSETTWTVNDSVSVPLNNYFKAQDVNGTIVRFTFVSGTSLVSGTALAGGTNTVDVVLSDSATPATVANFLYYANAQGYDNTFLHRSTDSPGILQGGGFGISGTGSGTVSGTTALSGTVDLSAASLVALTGTGTIANESNDTTRPNQAWTLAMTGSNGPNNATTQWRFNTADNSANASGTGYAVFGTVLSGTDILSQIRGIPTANMAGRITGTAQGSLDSAFDSIPLRNVPAGTDTATVPQSDLVMLASVRVVPSLKWQVTSDAPDIVDAAVSSNGQLNLSHGTRWGTANITVTAIDWHGNQTSSTFAVASQFPEPQLTGTIPDQAGMASGTITLDASRYFQLSYAGTVVEMAFTGGALSGTETIDLALTDTATPVTVANFLNYVQSGAYVNSFIHRIGSSEGLGIIQGGGFGIAADATELSGSTFVQIPAAHPIINESSTTRPNILGTIAMARTGDPNSATSQWFINTDDNTSSLGGADSAGYTVFGSVLGSGTDVANTIYGMQSSSLTTINSALSEVPTQSSADSGASSVSVSDLVTVVSATVVTPAVYTVSSDNPSIDPSVSPNGIVTISWLGSAPSEDTTATITLTVTDRAGLASTTTFPVTMYASGCLFSTGTANMTVSGTAGKAVVHILHSGNTGGTVNYQTTDGTALSGIDYTPVNNHVTFSANDTDISVSIPIRNNGLAASPGKTFTLNLSVSDTSSAVVGTPSSCAITIADPACVLQFVNSPYQTNAGGFAVVQVQRSGGTAGTVSAVVTCQDNDAINGTDYQAIAQQVTFLPGDTAIRPVYIPILSSTATGIRSFYVTLSTPTGGAALGSNANTYVQILEQSATQGVFAFEFPQFSYACGGAGTATICVQRFGGSGSTSSVYYTTTNGSLADGGDYTAVHGLLTFGASEAVKFFQVPIKASGKSGTINLHLVNASSGASLATLNSEAVLNVTRNAQASTVQFQQAKYTGNIYGSISPTLTRNGTNTAAFSAYVQLTSGDYTVAEAAGQTVKVDFLAGSYTAVIPTWSGSTTGSSFTAQLIGVDPGFNIGTLDSATVTMDGQFTFSNTSYTVSASGTSALIVVGRTGYNTLQTVAYSTVPGTAVAGVDYIATSGTLTFGYSDSYRYFVVPILAGSGTTDKTLTLHLSQPAANNTVGPDATLTIMHDTGTNAVAFSSNAYHVDAGNAPSVSLAYSGSGTPTVSAQAIDGSAVFNKDYYFLNTSSGTASSLPSTISFAASSGATLPIYTSTSAVGKSFRIKLGADSSGCVIGTPDEAVVTVNSETFDFSPNSYLVSNSTSQVSLCVVRSATATAQSVSYATKNGSATAGVDYTAASGTLAFAAGESSKVLPLISVSNSLQSSANFFTVQLSSTDANAYVGAATVNLHSSQATSVQIASVDSFIAAGGTLTLTLSRTGTASATAYVRFQDDTAVLGQDYFVSGNASGVAAVSFASGTDTATLSITCAAGALGKRFSLQLLSSDQLFVTGSDTASIVVSDLLQFAPSATAYRVSGSSGQAVLAVTRSGSAANESFTYATTTGTDSSAAVDGTNFTATSGTVTFGAGEQLKTFTGPILASGSADLSFNVQLTATDAQVAAPASVVIAGSATPVVQFGGSNYQVARSGSVSIPLVTTGTVDTTATILLGGTATLGTDCNVTGTNGATGVSGSLISITVPASSGTTLTVTGLGSSDARELSLSLLTAGSQSAVGPAGLATVAIVDQFAFSPSVYSVNGSGTAGGQAVFEVTRTTATGSASVVYTTGTGTAINGTDFVATTGTLHFIDGQTALTGTVPILATSGTAGVAFPIQLTSTAAGYVTGGAATVTIARTSPAQLVSITSDTYRVSQSGTLNVVLTRQPGTTGSCTATVRIESDTATLGSDFTVAGASGDLVTATFPDGSATSSAITVTAGANVAMKSFRLRVLTVQSGSNNCAVGSPSVATVNLGESIGFVPSSCVISGSVTRPFTLEVVRTGTTSDETVTYTPVAGTAAPGTDYLFTAGTLSFPAGVQSQVISGTVVGASGINSNFAIHLASTTSLAGSDAVVSIVRQPDASLQWVVLAAQIKTVVPGQQFSVNLTRTGADLSNSATVTLRIEDGTAVAGADYSIDNSNGNLVTATFTAGSATATVTGTPTVQSSGKTFALRLIAADAGCVIGLPDAVTIQSEPMFLMQDSACSALASGSTAKIVVRRTAADTAETVQYATTDGTVISGSAAISGTHYIAASGTLSFAVGALEATIPVTLLNGTGDSFTGTRNFSVSLSNPSGGYLVPDGSATTTVNIVYDTAHTAYSFDASSYAFDALTGGTVTVLRSGSAAGAETIAVDVLDGSAIAALGDYTTTPAATNHVASLTFQSADTSKTLVVSGTTGPEKSFALHIGGSGSMVAGAVSDATIALRPNGALELSSTLFRMDQATGEAVVNVIRHGGTTGTASVVFTTSDGPLSTLAPIPATAHAGSDYTATSGTLTFGDGVWSQEIKVPLTATSATNDRAFTITLSSPGGGAVLGSPTQCSVTIFQNPTGGVFSLDSTEYRVNASGTASIRISRSITTGTAQVNLVVTDNTAIQNQDYTLASSGEPRSFNVVFKPGLSYWDMPIVASATSPKDFFVQLRGVPATGTSAASATTDPTLARVTLIPNPPQGHIDFISSSYRILKSGSAAMLTLVRSGTQGVVSVTYRTDDATAVSGTDYTGTTDGSVEFQPGVTEQNIVIPLLATSATSDRMFSVSLVSASGGAVVGAQDQAEITLVQSAPGGVFALDATSYRIVAPNAGGSLRIVRSATGQESSVSVRLFDGSAVLNTDYNPIDVVSGSSVSERTVEVSFGATDLIQYLQLSASNTVTKNLTIQLVDCSEGSVIGAPSLATVTLVAGGSTQQVNLVQDSCTVTVGNTNAYLAIQRSGTTGTVTVNCATQDGSAVAGRDYTAVNKTVTFGPGEDTQIVSVPLSSTAAAGSPAFTVNLSNPSANAIIGGTDRANVSLTNAVRSDAIQFDNGTYHFDTAIESSGTVNLVRSSTDTVETVNVFVSGSAVLGTDFQLALDNSSISEKAFPVTFQAGDSTKSIQITPLATAQFSLNLIGDSIGANNTAAVTLATSTTGIIDFGSPSYRFAGSAGSATLTVNRFGTTTGTMSVAFSTVNGSAVAGLDYQATTGVVTFNPGETQKTISIPLIASTRNEKTFTVALASPTGASLGVLSSATVTVYNSISGSIYAFSDSSYRFQNSSYYQSVTITRTNPSSSGTVVVELLNGSGQFDLTGTTGTGFTTNSTHTADAVPVSFVAGQSSATLPVAAYSGQGTVTLSMRLVDAPAGSGFGTPSSATVTFYDESIAFAADSYRLYLPPTTGAVHSSGMAYLTVTRQGSAADTATVQYSTADGSAKAGSRYTGTSGTLTFAPYVYAQDIPIRIMSGTATQSFTVTLTNPQASSGVILDQPSTSTVIVAASAPAGVIQFSASSYTLQESQSGYVYYRMLTRSGTDAAVAYVEAIDGTAKQGIDFATYGGYVIPVSFQPGQSYAWVGIDAPVAVSKNFSMRIVSVPPGYKIGSQASTTVNLAQDSVFSFDSSLAASARFKSTDGSITVPVLRSSTTSVASVNYSVTAGKNTIVVNRPLVFNLGESEKMISVPISQKLIDAGTVHFSLSSPGDGSLIGTPSTFAASVVKETSTGVFHFEHSAYQFNCGESHTVTIRRTASASAAAVYVKLLGPTTAAKITLASSTSTVLFTSGNIAALTLPAGVQSVSLSVTGSSGSGDQQVALWLAGVTAGSAIGSPASTTVSLTDGAYAALVQFAPPSYAVERKAKKATITVTRSQTRGTVAVPWQTAPGTAKAGADFVSTSGVATFAAGEASKTFDVTLKASSSRQDRAFSVYFTAPPTGDAILGTEKSATITLTNSAPTGYFELSASGYRFDAGQVGTITIRRNTAAKGPATVYLLCQDGAGSRGALFATDYGVVNHASPLVPVTFIKGQTSAFVALTSASGRGDKTMSVRLVGCSQESGIGAPGSASVTFVDPVTDSSVVEFLPSTYSVEGAKGTVSVSVLRTGTGTAPLKVHCYKVAGSTAEVGGPLATTGTTFTLNAGERTRVIAIPFTPPTDRDRIIRVRIGSPVAEIGGESVAVVTIHRSISNGSFAFRANNYRFLPGSDGVVTVVRNGLAKTFASVYVELNGSAVLGSDYTASNAIDSRPFVLGFAAGQRSRTFTVRGIAGRGEKTLQATLVASTDDTQVVNPMRAKISFADTTNQHGVVNFASSRYYVNESDSSAILNITRTGTVGTITVDYATANGTAIANTDYEPIGKGSITFAPGQSSRAISVRLINNHKADGPSRRTFNVKITSIKGGATMGASAATTAMVTIFEATNPHGVFRFEKPVWSFNRNSGWAELVIVRTGGSGGSADIAIAPVDGVPAAKNLVYSWPVDHTSQNVHFGPGQTRQSLFIPLLDPTLSGTTAAASAGTRSFSVLLKHASAGLIGAPTTTSVTAVDASSVSLPSVEFEATQYRVNDNAGTLTVGARLLGTATTSVAVPYTIHPGTARAKAAFDLPNGSESGSFVFPVGATEATLTFPIKHDKTDKTPWTPKQFSIVLGQSPDAQLLDQTSATVTVVNTAAREGVFEFASSAYSCDADCGAVTLILKRSGVGAVRAIVETEDGTLAGNEYGAKNTISGHPNFAATQIAVDFAANQKEKEVPIQILGGAGNFLVRIVSLETTDSTPRAVEATAGARDRAVVTVIDPSAVNNMSVDFDRPSYDANDTDPSVTLTVRRSGTNTGDVLQVDYTVTSASAKPNVDYVPINGTANIGAYQFTAPIQVRLKHHALPSDRKFIVTLSNPRDGTTTAAAQLLVNNRVEVTLHGTTKPDGQFQFDKAAYNAVGDNGQMTVMILRTGSLKNKATVDVRTADRAAVGNVDYLERIGAVTFDVGEAHAQIPIPIRSSSTARDFVVGLYGTNTGATGAIDTTTVTIIPSSLLSRPAVEIASPSFSVDDIPGGTSVMLYLRNYFASADPIVAHLKVFVPSPHASEYATPGADFTPVADQTFTFPSLSQSGSLSIPIHYRPSLSGSHNFFVQITSAEDSANPVQGVDLMANTLVPIAILSVNRATGGVIDFDRSSQNVSRRNGAAVIRLLRYGSTTNEVAAEMAVIPNAGTARPGVDYGWGGTPGKLAYPSVPVYFGPGVSFVDVSFTLMKTLPAGVSQTGRTVYLELVPVSSSTSTVGTRDVTELTIGP